MRHSPWLSSRDIAQGNLNNVVTLASMEGGGAIAAERMALNRLLKVSGMIPISPAEERAFREFDDIVNDVLNGRRPYTDLTEAQSLAARKYLQEGMNPRGNLPEEAVRQYQIERANCVLNGGPAPGRANKLA